MHWEIVWGPPSNGGGKILNSIPPKGFRGCRSHRAKAFLVPKVPYRPRNAKIKVYYPRPICIALRKGVGKILSTNVLYPPRVFGGADHIGPKHF